MTWEEDRTMMEKQQRVARRPPPSSSATGDGKVTRAREPRRAGKGNIWEHLSLWGFADDFRLQRAQQRSSGVREEGRCLREGGQSRTERRQGSGGDRCTKG